MSKKKKREKFTCMSSNILALYGVLESSQVRSLSKWHRSHYQQKLPARDGDNSCLGAVCYLELLCFHQAGVSAPVLEYKTGL